MTLTHLQKVRKLYKTIMKLHRGLPKDLEELGNNYTRDEFKRHKKCNEAEAKIFMNEWSSYALSLADQLGIRGLKRGEVLGAPLSVDDLDAFRDEQLRQLYELKLAAKEKELTK